MAFFRSMYGYIKAAKENDPAARNGFEIFFVLSGCQCTYVASSFTSSVQVPSEIIGEDSVAADAFLYRDRDTSGRDDRSEMLYRPRNVCRDR